MTISEILPTIVVGLVFVFIPIVFSYIITKKDFTSENPKRIFWRMPSVTALLAILLIIIGEIIFYSFGGTIHGEPIELIWIYYFPIVILIGLFLVIYLYFLKFSKRRMLIISIGMIILLIPFVYVLLEWLL